MFPKFPTYFRFRAGRVARPSAIIQPRSSAWNCVIQIRAGVRLDLNQPVRYVLWQIHRTSRKEEKEQDGGAVVCRRVVR